MERRRLTAFCHFADTRLRLRQQCVDAANVAPFLFGWVALTPKQAVPTATTATAAPRTPGSKPETEQQQNQPRPTRDNLLLPRDTEESPIEWAVANFLRTEHPEIYRKLIRISVRQFNLAEPPAEDEAA